MKKQVLHYCRTRAISLLRLLGKGDDKIAVVFATNADSGHEAVSYLTKEIPGLPVWLFSTMPPRRETESLCSHVFWQRSSIILLVRAQSCLWPRRVAICVGTWDGEHGRWLVKLAPFLVPPFRVLLRNANGDFLQGSAANVLLHAKRRLHDTLHTQWSGAKDHLQAALLTGAGTALSWFGYPHRRWFARIQGDSRTGHGKPDLAPVEPGKSMEIARFVATGTRWYADVLERFARSTDARWILWQQDGGDRAAVEDLVSVFTDAATFAASRQESFRAWKPMLFPMAAFRALSPGEGTAVLAPIGKTILVDRAKLLSVGIPRCRRPETAWMLCFWKAAAAGWRSYSVGQSARIQEQPDLPIPETEFIFHLLRDARLQRLGPGEPDRLRGNVVFATAARKAQPPAPDRMRILLVSPFLPYPLAHGGAVRIYNLCRELARDVDFILVTLREANEVVDYAKLGEVFKEVYVVDLDELPSAEESLPDQVRQHRSRSLRAVIQELAERWRPDLLQIEYTHMAGFRDAAPGIPAILVEHDLTFALYRQLAGQRPGVAALREYERWLDFERRWLAAYEAVWTMSEEDRQRAASGSPKQCL
jgi:Glycosyl transferase 4-like domain